MTGAPLGRPPVPVSPTSPIQAAEGGWVCQDGTRLSAVSLPTLGHHLPRAAEAGLPGSPLSSPPVLSQASQLALDVAWNPLLPSPGPTPGKLSCTGPLVLDQVSPVPVWASIGGSGHSVCLRPASSSSQDSVLLSFPDQRHGCHLTPCVFPGSENGTAPNPGGDRLSDPGVTLSSLSPTSTPSESTPALPPDCPDAGRLSPSLPAPGPASSLPPCCHLPEGPC